MAQFRPGTGSRLVDEQHSHRRVCGMVLFQQPGETTMQTHRQNDPWNQTISLLALASGAPSPVRGRIEARLATLAACPPRWPRDARQSRSQSIRILEWTSEASVLICWRDATLGYYAEQKWRLAFSRAAGRCCLSGKPINRGDTVFRPSTRGAYVPANSDAQILACELPRPVDVLPAAS
jgi:Domain of unknown function (DUF3331)